jgi:hypothetical protein
MPIILRKILTLASILSLFFANVELAHAQTYPDFYKGSDIYSACLNNENSCSYYIAGILTLRYNSGIDSISNTKNNSAEACIPGGYDLKRIVFSVRKFLVSHPSLRKDPSAADVIQQAIINLYSC